MHRHLLNFVQKLFITFTLFLSFNLTAQTTTPCAKYEVISTNNFCGCSSDLFRPYGLFIEANNACGLDFFKPDSVVFEIRSDSTAAIHGVFRTFADWRPVHVDITMAKIASSTPRLDLCLSSSSTSVANQWRYFGAMSGTIQFDSAAPLSVNLRGTNFQVGIGANGQNTDQFGGSGFFTLSNGQRGGFGFTLTNPSAGSCLLVNPCLTDVIPPVLSNCPQNISLSTSSTGAVATWTAPTATDNCSNPAISSNFVSGTTFPIGTTSVIYTAHDVANNTAVCQFGVTVTRLDPCLNDVIPPIFSNCPQNISLSTSNTGAVATWTAPTATDNCNVPSVSNNFVSGTTFPIGITQVIYTARDAANNSAECRFNITVTRIDPCSNDVTPPVWSNCPQNISLSTSGTNAVATWATPTATDNCTTPLVSINYISGTGFPIGTTQVIYTAQDAANNTAVCRFNVVVTHIDPCLNDVIPPVFSNCPQNISLSTAGTSAVATWATPTATDNCNTPSVSSNFVSGTAFPVGTTQVFYIARDAANNSTECRFNVVVTRIDLCSNDVTPPVFSNCPQNISLSTAGTSAIATWATPTATDNCNTPSVSSNFVSGTAFPVGTTQVFYIARDAANNSTECRFNVVVTRIDLCSNDVTPPVFSNCPQNISLSTAGTSAIATWPTPTATDNCNTPSVSSNFVSGTAFPIGTTQVIYTAQDAANNIALCRFNVVVTRIDPCSNDVTPPVFSNCPQNISLSTSGTSTIANWTAPTATDNCTLTSVSSNITPSTSFLIGTTAVVYTARDAANNSTECRFNIIVSKQTATPGTCTSYKVNNTNDICSCPTRQWTPFGLFIAAGTDGCGEYYQADKVDFQINGDSSARLVGTFRTGAWQPVWLDIQWAKTGQKDPRFSNCANDTAAAQTWRYFGTAQGNIQFGEEHPLSVINKDLLQVGISANKQNRDLFGASGLISLGDGRTASINIVLNSPISSTCSLACVNDSVAPQILNCPKNSTQLVVQAPVAATWAAPSVRDDCSSPTLTTTHLPGDFFGEGETTVVYTARDVSGNQSVCSFKVTVSKVVAGSLCSTYDVENTNDICGCSANQWKPYALRVGANNCGDYYKADSVVLHINGDSSAQLQGRFRSDYWQPVMVDVRFAKTSLHTPRFELCQNSNSEAATQWQYFGAMSGTIRISDAAPVAIKSGSLLQIGKGANGQNPNIVGGNVNFILEDGTTASFNLVLSNYQQFICPDYNPCAVDITKPTLSKCPKDTTVITVQSVAPVRWTAPTAIDNCSTPSVTSNFASGASFPWGSTVVTYTAKDSAGNTTQCRFTVTVNYVSPCAEDITPPLLTNCPTNMTVTTTENVAPATWAMPTVTDNCSTPSVFSNFPSGLVFNVGNTIIVITAVDVAGNKSQCLFTVTVSKLTAVNDPNTFVSMLKVAPNPATTQIALKFQSLLTDEARLDISNALGQTVFQEKIQVKEGDNHLPIDVSFLAKGVYYLTVRNTQFNMPKTIRFVKL